MPHTRKISVVVPVYNEEKSLQELIRQLAEVLPGVSKSYEIIAVDDGSSDRSFFTLSAMAKENRHVSAVRLKRNFGQTAALAAGIEHATGEIIITIDSDLENDPRDILRLVAKLDEGYDVVSGWRQNRWQGDMLSRRIPSYAANKMISRVTGVRLHDYGCTLKAYRADALKGLMLYGDMHRFVPAYIGWQGGKIAELPVSHRPRMSGKSNYGIGRTFRVLLDLVVFVFLHRYVNRPMHFFGGWGIASLALGALAGVVSVLLKVFHLRDFVATPLPVFSALFIIVGVQLIMFGVIGELLMRTYYESQNRRPYAVAETISS